MLGRRIPHYADQGAAHIDRRKAKDSGLLRAKKGRALIACPCECSLLASLTLGGAHSVHLGALNQLLYLLLLRIVRIGL
jgi:hypothetical protein